MRDKNCSLTFSVKVETLNVYVYAEKCRSEKKNAPLRRLLQDIEKILIFCTFWLAGRNVGQTIVELEFNANVERFFRSEHKGKTDALVRRLSKSLTFK